MTQEIKTEKFEGLLVKLPDEAHAPTISKDGWLYWAINGSRNTGQEELPEGEWKLIGNPFELSEEECRSFLLNVGPSFEPTYIKYPYITNNPEFVKSGKEAFNSLLKSLHVYKVNTWPKPEIEDYLSGSQYHHFLRKWEQSEERTGNWVLLEKLNN